jgi:hypothetical protein
MALNHLLILILAKFPETATLERTRSSASLGQTSKPEVNLGKQDWPTSLPKDINSAKWNLTALKMALQSVRGFAHR